MATARTPQGGASVASGSAVPRGQTKRFAAKLKLGLVRLAVREPLASRTLYRKDCTFPIVEAKPNAVIVPEIILCKVPMQMLLFAMLIDAAAYHAWYAVPGSVIFLWRCRMRQPLQEKPAPRRQLSDSLPNIQPAQKVFDVLARILGRNVPAILNDFD